MTQEFLPTSEFAMTGMPSDVKDRTPQEEAEYQAARDVYIADRARDYRVCANEMYQDLDEELLQSGVLKTFLMQLELAHDYVNPLDTAREILNAAEEMRKEQVSLAQRWAASDADDLTDDEMFQVRL